MATTTDISEDEDDEGAIRCIQDTGVLFKTDFALWRPPVLSGYLPSWQMLPWIHHQPEQPHVRLVTMGIWQEQTCLRNNGNENIWWKTWSEIKWMNTWMRMMNLKTSRFPVLWLAEISISVDVWGTGLGCNWTGNSQSYLWCRTPIQRASEELYVWLRRTNVHNQ